MLSAQPQFAEGVVLVPLAEWDLILKVIKHAVRVQLRTPHGDIPSDAKGILAQSKTPLINSPTHLLAAQLHHELADRVIVSDPR